MKLAILFFCTACLWFSFSSDNEAQQRWQGPPPSAANATTEKTPRVRFVGLHFADVSVPPGDPLYAYFRFYSDSTGLTFCCTPGKPTVVAERNI